MKLVNFTRSFFVFSRTLEIFRWCLSALAINFLFLRLWFPFLCPGHLKGSYDNHSSGLNCSGCFRSSCCSVCQLWPDSTWSLVAKRRCSLTDKGWARRRRKRRKQRKGRIPPLGIIPVQDGVLNRLLRGRTHPGLPLTVMMMTTPRFCLCHHRGVRGNTGVPGSRSSHGTPGLSLKGRRTQRSTPRQIPFRRSGW